MRFHVGGLRIFDLTGGCVANERYISRMIFCLITAVQSAPRKLYYNDILVTMDYNFDKHIVMFLTYVAGVVDDSFFSTEVDFLYLATSS